jgi:hypothetical protein
MEFAPTSLVQRALVCCGPRFWIVEQMKYKLEIEIVVQEKNEARTIEFARECFRLHGGARELVDGKRGKEEMRDIQPEDFIDDVEAALMELLEQNPLLKKAGVEVVGVTGNDLKCEHLRQGKRPFKPF